MEHNKGSRESSWLHLAPEHILNIPGLTASNTVLRGAEEAARCWRIGNTFVLASLLSESKRESRKLLGKAGVLSLSLGPVSKVQSIFFPWLTTDLKINENLLLRIAVVPGRGLCLPLRKPEQAESHAAPIRVTIPKERSPFGSEPSGPCQRRSLLNAVSSRWLSSPCLSSLLLVILSQFWTRQSWGLFGFLCTQLSETFRKCDWGQLCCTPAKRATLFCDPSWLLQLQELRHSQQRRLRWLQGMRSSGHPPYKSHQSRETSSLRMPLAQTNFWCFL